MLDFDTGCSHIPLPGGELQWHPHYLDDVVADNLFHLLQQSVDWQQDELRIAGRWIPVPRLQAWFGNKNYRYSGLDLQASPMTPELRELSIQLGEQLNVTFNSVLVNLYRDGNDSVGWHSDDEPELGINPCIASLSLGATRCFQLRHKRESHRKYSLDLTSGSLLVMAGETQHHWRHQLAKVRHAVGPRINLTFRYIE